MKITIHSIFLLFIIANVIYIASYTCKTYDYCVDIKDNKIYTTIHFVDDRFKVDSNTRRA